MTRHALRLSASVTCMNPLTYTETIRGLDAAGLSAYHVDVCDGRFAKTFLLYPGLLPYLREVTGARLDVHLYCLQPSLYIDEFVERGADSIIVQMEAHEDYAPIVARIAGRGIRAGLGILPGTPVPDSIREILPVLSMVVANTVGPAFAGQPYDPRGLQNLDRVRALCDEVGATPELVVDGAVNEERLEAAFSCGANHLVLGTSSVFTQRADWPEKLRAFRAIAEASFERFGRQYGS